MGCLNRLPCLRNGLLPKWVHSALGVMGMSNKVPVDLEDLDARYRWILEISIDIKVGAEVAPLLVKPLLASILCSSRSHGFLCSVDITKESRSDGRRESFHKICIWG